MPEEAIRRALPTSLGQTHQPEEAGNSRSNSHKPEKPKKRPSKAGSTPARRDRGKHPQDPPLGNRESTLRSQRRWTTTATEPTPGQKKDHPGQADKGPQPGMGRPTNYGAADTARTAGKGTEPRSRRSRSMGGGNHRDHGRKAQDATHPTTADNKSQQTTAGSTTHVGPHQDRQQDHPPQPPEACNKKLARKKHRQDPLPPATSDRSQQGRAEGHTQRAHHRAGRTTPQTSANTSPHPKKEENNTHRAPPRNSPTSGDGRDRQLQGPPRGSMRDHHTRHDYPPGRKRDHPPHTR